MHLYLNYARENWTHKDENPPVGLILCAEKDAAVASYALEGLPNKVLAAEYRMALPDEKGQSNEFGWVALLCITMQVKERHYEKLGGGFLSRCIGATGTNGKFQ